MRRAGYTNTLVPPKTWTDGVVVGATDFNPYLRDNILAIDNRITPISQDIVHYTPPVTKVTVSNGRIVMPSKWFGVNMLGLSQYSPNLAMSIDAVCRLTNVTASGISFEAVVAFRETTASAFSNSLPVSYFKYRMYVTPSFYDSSVKDPGIGATNFVFSPHLGATNYAVWSGYVQSDMYNRSPFALSGQTYSVQSQLVIAATNGSVDVFDPFWSTRMRANVALSIPGAATSYNGGGEIYPGQVAF